MYSQDTLPMHGICPTCNNIYDFCKCLTGVRPGMFPEGIPINPWETPEPAPTTKIIIGINPERFLKFKQRLREILNDIQTLLLELEKEEINDKVKKYEVADKKA